MRGIFLGMGCGGWRWIDVDVLLVMVLGLRWGMEGIEWEGHDYVLLAYDLHIPM